MKRLFASIMVVVMILTAAPLSGFAGLDFPDLFSVFASAASYSGACGDNLTWSLDTETGELVIDGTGEMKDYPWIRYDVLIKTVIIGSGVKSICSGAFIDCVNITDVYYNGDLASWCSISFNSSFADLMSIVENLYINGKLVEGELVIPAGVTTIPKYAFSNCKKITSLVIPDGVTEIGIYAFSDCKGLTSVTIPKSVKFLNTKAFDGCVALTDFYYTGSLTDWLSTGIKADGNPMKYADNFYIDGKLVSGKLVIPDGITEIGNYAFDNYNQIASIEIPDSVKSIGDGAFSTVRSLTDVIVPDSVESIGKGAFTGCSGLKNFTLGKGVKTIGEGAFSSLGVFTNIYYTGTLADWCSIQFGEFAGGSPKSSKYVDIYIDGQLLSGDIVIPYGVTSICGAAFYNCNKITSFSIPETVTSIGTRSFYGCEGITEIILPDSIESIGYAAFEYCKGLTSAVIPDSVTVMDEYAFQYCSALTKVSIGSGIKSIGGRAFGGCTSLTDIYYNGTEEDWNAIKIYQVNTEVTNAAKHFNAIKKGTCGDNLTWTLNTETGEFVVSGTGDMYGYEFSYSPWWHSYNSLIKKVIISDGVTSIGDYAFYACRNLQSITIGNTVKSIGAHALADCTLLIRITIPDSVSYIDCTAFCLGTPLMEINVGSNNQYYSTDSYGVLYNKDKTELVYYPIACGMTEFAIPDGVESIADYAFEGCYDLKEIPIPDSVTSIGFGSFSYTGLEKITIPDSVSVIGNSAFAYSKSLSGVSIGNGVAEIGKEMFMGCIKLENIIIGSKVKSIGSYAFSDCIKLTNITIPDSVTFIDIYAFKDCQSLAYIDIGSGIKEIEHYVFDGCDNLSDVYYNGTQEQWNEISIGQVLNEDLLNATIHFNAFDHICDYGEWTVITEPTATTTGSKSHTCVICEKIETVEIPATGFEPAEGVAIDFATNTISGLNAGESSLENYLVPVDDSYIWEYETQNGRLGTGSKVILKDGDIVIGEYTILVYGDTTGDSWYDGQDAVIVSCLANDMLTQDDVGEAVYTAADCNHDGVIDESDVALLNEAGTLLTEVDQSKTAEVLLETSSAYVEYLELIDQSPEIDDETDVDTTPEPDEGKAEISSIIEVIFNFIKSIFEMLLAYIPVPYK